jgi:ribose transport system substrate-binding protein
MSDTGKADAPVLAVFTKNRSNPAYDAARFGAEQAAARLGARVVHYVPAIADSIEQQAALVERAIADRPDAVLFVPVHATAMAPSVQRLEASGIPVINYLNHLDEGAFVSFVGCDDFQLGIAIAEYLFCHLVGSGNVVIIEGVPGAVTNRERLRGFQLALKRRPGIRLAASRSGFYQREPAAEAMRDMLEEVPEIHGIIAAADIMALGAIEALQESGKEIPIVSVNAIPEAITAIKAGTLLASADFDPMKIAAIATEAAVRHLRGDPVPREITLPVAIVDHLNCAQWDLPIEKRPCPSWTDVVKEIAQTRP